MFKTTLSTKCLSWEIYLPEQRRIIVHGKTLIQAVKEYGLKHPRKLIECGLLVRIRHKGISLYWSGEEFLRHLK